MIHNPKAVLLAVTFTSIAAAMSAFAQGAPPTWAELGGSATEGGVSNMDSFTTGVNITVGSDGFPVILWQEQNPLGKYIFARRWNGDAWVGMGGSGSGSGIVSTTYQYLFPGALAANSSGHIFAGFTESYRACLLRWDGQSWGGLAGSGTGISTGAFNSRMSAIAIDPSGNPWVVLTVELDFSGSGEIYVLRWDGSAWVELGGSASGGGVSHSPTDRASDGRLAFGADGNPIVAWSEIGSSLTESHVYVRRWDGTAWVEMGGSASGGGVSNLSKGLSTVKDLKVDRQGRPVVVWNGNENYPKEVYLRRWNGSAWVELAGSGSDHGISGIRLGVGGWEQSCSGGALGFDPTDNPIVAWSEGDAFTPYEVRLLRWDGDSWEGIEGSFDAAGLGASASGHPARSGMAVNRYGDIFVAWEDGPVAEQEIHLRHWRNARVDVLGQYKIDGSTPLSVGAMTIENMVVLRGQGSRALVDFPFRLQFEIRGNGEAFTGIPMSESELTAALTQAGVTVSNLVLGSWRWKARAVESTGYTSTWESFGGNPEGNADFWVVAPQVTTPEPPSPTSPAVGDDGSKGCGLLGIEAPLLLVLLARIRRKRATTC